MQPRTTEDTLVPSSNLQVSNGRGTQDWQADASADAGPSVGCSGGGGQAGFLEECIHNLSQNTGPP